MQSRPDSKTPAGARKKDRGAGVASAWSRPAVSLLALLLLAAILRLYQLTRDPLWYDEVMYTLLCRNFSLDAATARTIRIEPLFYLFLWAWEKVSQADFWVRLHAVFAGVATVALAFRVGGHLAGRRGAVLFSLLAAVAPFLVFYSRDAKMYGWLAFLELAAAWLALRYSEQERGGALLAGYTLCGIALVHTHVLSGVFLAALNVALVVAVRMSWRKSAGWCLAQCAVLAASLPYLWMQWRLAAGMQEVVFWVPPPTARSLWVLCGNLFSGYAPGFWPRLALPALLFPLMAAGVILSKSRRRWVLAAVIAGALNILAFYAISRFSRWSFFVDRYMIGTLPLWLMAAAAGLAALRPAPLRHALLTALVGLSLVGLGGLYRGVLSPDMRDHLGVIRSVDTRAMAKFVREHRGKGPGEAEALWHVSWETFLTAKWYLPEMRHIAVEMDGELSMAMARDEIACRKDYYDARAVALEPAAAGLQRIWLVVPESEAPIYPRFRGFQAWLEARANCPQRMTQGGHMAPSGLYLYQMDPSAPQGRNALDLPLVTDNGTDRLRASIADTPAPGDGTSRLRLSGTGTRPAAAHCVAFAADCTLDAAGFTRQLGPQSRWVLQLYGAGQWPRLAFRNTMNQDSPQGDALTRQIILPPGAYDVFVERLAGGEGALNAPLMVAVDGRAMPAASGSAAGPADWQWVRVGAFTSTGRELRVSLSPFNPENRPEMIPVFSEVAFVRRAPDSPPMTTPVLLETDAPLGPKAFEVAGPPASAGRAIEWLIVTMEQCGRLTDAGRAVTLPGSPAR